MARDITAGVQTTQSQPADLNLAANAAACVASHAQHAADARMLLDALGITDAVPLARALLRLTRKETR